MQLIQIKFVPAVRHDFHVVLALTDKRSPLSFSASVLHNYRSDVQSDVNQSGRVKPPTLICNH